MTKLKGILTPENSLMFNGRAPSLGDDGNTIHLRPKVQGKKTELVNTSLAKSPKHESKNHESAKQDCICQRDRGAYLASIYQPEACFGLSAAVQIQDPSKDDIERLNKRLQ